MTAVRQDLGQGASKASSVRDVQRIVDQLAARLRRPAAVDDPRFRLQVYSPQTGPLDEVRVISILFRDSPEDAKRWVLSHGIAETTEPVRLPAAEHLGLLPRVCVPIWHEGTLLGYLWVIDADESVSQEDLELCGRVAHELAPRLFRLRALDLLDRETERQALAGLIGDDPSEREAAAQTLQRSGVLSATMRPIAFVAEVATAGPGGLVDAEAVALEVGIERTRRLVAEPHVAQFRTADQAVFLIGTDDAQVRRHGVAAVAGQVYELLAAQLPGHRLVVGIGHEQATLGDAVVSYRDASDAARILKRTPTLGAVASVDELRIYRPMLYVPDEILAASIPQAFVELIGREELCPLADTLEVFLDKAGDVTQTAELLRLHRATVYKRLKRLSKILHADLGSGLCRRELHHAYAVARFLGRWPMPG